MALSLGQLLQDRLSQVKDQKIENILKRPGTEWTDWVEKCRIAINDERPKYGKYPKLSFVAVRNKVAHLDTPTLQWFYKECMRYKTFPVSDPEEKKKRTFSRAFFGALKIPT